MGKNKIMDLATFLVNRRHITDRMEARRQAVQAAWGGRRRVFGVPVGTWGKMAISAGALIGWRRWLPPLLLAVTRPYLGRLFEQKTSDASWFSKVFRFIQPFRR